MVVEDSDLRDGGGDFGEEIGGTHEVKKVEVGDSGEREMVGGDRGVNPVGEEEGWGGGGGEGRECAVWARVVV